MRPELVAWLGRFGYPVWLVPNYFIMGGTAALVGCIIVLRIAQKDGVNIRIQIEALACGYVAALIGGNLFEIVRMIPYALYVGSWAPLFDTGRAAYGALLSSLLAAALYLRWKGESVGAFFDRVSLGAGAVFAIGRVGCFLAGCDYGLPTASPLGVRFPPGSFAAVDHVQRGWVPMGAASLPVHPTQLYESGIGVIAAVAAWFVLRRGVRDGRALMTWISVYAGGRFMNEFLRGDMSRGVYGWLSTSQYVSLAVLATCGYLLLRRTQALRLVVTGIAVVVAALCVMAPGVAQAQEGDFKPFPAKVEQEKGKGDGAAVPGKGMTPPPMPQPEPVVRPASEGAKVEGARPPAGAGEEAGPGKLKEGAEAGKPEETASAEVEKTRYLQREGQGMGFRMAVFPSSPGRWSVPGGFGMEVDSVYRVRMSSLARLEVGVDLRLMQNREATHYGIGPMANLVLETSGPIEVTAGVAVDYTWFQFESPFFASFGRPVTRVEAGLQYAMGSGMTLGGTVLSWTVVDNRTTGPFYAWEPRLWFGYAL